MVLQVTSVVVERLVSTNCSQQRCTLALTTALVRVSANTTMMIRIHIAVLTAVLHCAVHYLGSSEMATHASNTEHLL
jgi:hypothetical protein